MRLYYLEMKRLIRTKSVWILMIAMVVLAAVMAYVPVTFIRAYKTDAGNVQAVTGVQAVKISKETRKDMEGEVTEEKIRQAIRVLNEMYQEYGSSFMEEVPADVYAEKIYPIMPVLNVIEQVLVCHKNGQPVLGGCGDNLRKIQGRDSGIKPESGACKGNAENQRFCENTIYL